MINKLTALLELIKYSLKIPAVFLVVFVLALALILFLPNEYANTLAVDAFREKYRVYLGPIFLLAFLFCVARICIYIKQEYTKNQELKKLQKELHQLTPEEKEYLTSCISGHNTIKVSMGDDIMKGLLSKKITVSTESIDMFVDLEEYELQPWAHEYLTKNPKLLQGSVGKPIPFIGKL